MHRYTLCAAALLAASAASDAADSDSHYLIRGIGQSSCNSYNKARAADSDSYSHYINGYLTAYNAFAPDTYDITPGMDADAIIAWMDSYCADKQTSSFADAMSHLVEEMHEKREKTSPGGGARWP
jgi:hypothetical protein